MKQYQILLRLVVLIMSSRVHASGVPAWVLSCIRESGENLHPFTEAQVSGGLFTEWQARRRMHELVQELEVLVKLELRNPPENIKKELTLLFASDSKRSISICWNCGIVFYFVNKNKGIHPYAQDGCTGQRIIKYKFKNIERARQLWEKRQ